MKCKGLDDVKRDNWSFSNSTSQVLRQRCIPNVSDKHF